MDLSPSIECSNYSVIRPTANFPVIGLDPKIAWSTEPILYLYIKILEREVSKLYSLGEELAIQFDLSKTELIHFTKARAAREASLSLPNQELVQPKELVRWLGIWFDPGLSFKQHLAIRVSQARLAFLRMARLVNIEKGLSPRATRQLYLACMTSIADYRSLVWWRGQASFRGPL